MKYLQPISLIFAVALTLSGCADGLETGGAAGDAGAGEDPLAVALITPLVGLYDLPSNWAGQASSEAYFEIQAPNEAGIATSVLYELNDINNCFNPDPSPGSVTKDPFSDRIFLDTFEFVSSVISASGNVLTIDIGVDFQDVDDDGETEGDNDAALAAPLLGFMAIDIETCT